MLKAVKYRIYPTDEQAELFSRTFGCCRKIWNLMLSDKNDHYALTGKMLHNTPAQYKDEYPYLREVDSLALANVQLQLQTAYKSFFSGNADFPKYKSRKRSSRSYTTNNQKGTILVTDNSIRLPKIGAIKASIHRKLNGTIRSATVSRNHCMQYFCSVLYEIPDKHVNYQIDTDNAVGLDYKSDGLYVSSDDKICGSPKYYRLMERKLARAERRLSKKRGYRKNESPSNNFYKQKLRIAKIHQHITDQRLGFLHKESLHLAEQYDLVCIEDLDMKAVSNKGFHNGKATLDNGYGMFTKMLAYKLHDRGKQLVVIDRWFPSSQICHTCGYRNPITKDLKIRTVACPVCHKVYDRDYNAALNIRDEGIRQYLSGLQAVS
jgi:putative transposase